MESALGYPKDNGWRITVSAKNGVKEATGAKVEVVAPGTFPRTDFKARRVIDDREVFREMQARVR